MRFFPISRDKMIFLAFFFLIFLLLPTAAMTEEKTKGNGQTPVWPWASVPFNPHNTVQIMAEADTADAAVVYGRLSVHADKMKGCINNGGMAKVCWCQYPESLTTLREAVGSALRKHPAWKGKIVNFMIRNVARGIDMSIASPVRNDDFCTSVNGLGQCGSSADVGLAAKLSISFPSLEELFASCRQNNDLAKEWEKPHPARGASPSTKK